MGDEYKTEKSEEGIDEKSPLIFVGHWRVILIMQIEIDPSTWKFTHGLFFFYFIQVHAGRGHDYAAAASECLERGH